MEDHIHWIYQYTVDHVLKHDGEIRMDVIMTTVLGDTAFAVLTEAEVEADMIEFVHQLLVQGGDKATHCPECKEMLAYLDCGVKAGWMAKL
jgi:hypothetical protein